MKKIVSVTLLGILMVAMVFSSCKKKKDSQPDPSSGGQMYTEQEKADMIRDISAVSVIADSILLATNDVKDLEPYIEQFKALEKIEDAYISGNAFYIQIVKGGVLSWLEKPEIVVPPIDLDFIKQQKFKSCYNKNGSNKPLNNKMCLINQLYNDEDFAIINKYYHTLDSLYSLHGFEVTTVNGQDVDLDFLGKELNNYGTIFLSTHGGYDEKLDLTWFATGKKYQFNNYDYTQSWLDNFLAQNEELALWTNKEINITSINEQHNGQIEKVLYYIISNKYIEARYQENSFPNSLIYLVPCHGMESDNFAQTFIDKGAGIVIGWDETNCIGHSVGYIVFNLLLSGYDLSESVEVLPNSLKIDYCKVESGAHLRFLPENAGNFRLIDAYTSNAELIINTPVNNQESNERIIHVNGKMENMKEIKSVVVSINEMTFNLDVQDFSFNQECLISSGENEINILVMGRDNEDKMVSLHETIKVIGNFDPLRLYSALRWNNYINGTSYPCYSDVDFHLVKGENVADLFTSKDCYFNNTQTSWGAVLDIDDMNGEGPEHITIPNSANLEGKYVLYTHYYDNNGDASAQGYITLATNNGFSGNYGPLEMTVPYTNNNAGDLWAVCRIEYPSGRIIPLKQKNEQIPGYGGKIKQKLMERVQQHRK